MPIPPGVRFGVYEVVALLGAGAGGMGEVYRARDLRLRRDVALRILPDAQKTDARWIERFCQDARTISRLFHPNICALLDVGEANGRSYLAMEYLEGETIATRLTQGPLQADDAIRYAMQAADGLAHAHAAGVVHRDMKPGNLMLLPDGVIKILDFGLAKSVETQSADDTVVPHSAQGAIVNTVAYMSPEQTLGAQVDARSDIFSLGVVLYEMLAGVRPFPGNNALSVVQRINTYEPPGPEFYRPALPAAIGVLLRRMLAKAADLRPASALDVSHDLRAIAAGLGTRRLAANP